MRAESRKTLRNISRIGFLRLNNKMLRRLAVVPLAGTQQTLSTKLGVGSPSRPQPETDPKKMQTKALNHAVVFEKPFIYVNVMSSRLW